MPRSSAYDSNSASNHNNINNCEKNKNVIPVTLLLSVSCTVFDMYNNIPCTVPSELIREVLNMPANEGIDKLSQYLCTFILLEIYDDLERKNDRGKIRELVKKSQLFHIHGRSVRDIIYPRTETDDPHGHHGRVVFICTHC